MSGPTRRTANPLRDEDALRLDVLLAQQPLAIRIDDSRLKVTALTAAGEHCLTLAPNADPERYLRAVREHIASQVTGSPGGYPIHIRRWTRMGQMRDEHLEQLLVLGEPEAVVAVVCAPGLTDELARRAWWIGEDADNARRMLTRARVAGGTMGPRLAAYLVEHLPFETESIKIIETLRLVLQPDLLPEPVVQDLWHTARRRPLFYVGFLAGRPDDLPDQTDTCAVPDARLELAAAQGDATAALLVELQQPAGQAWLRTLESALAKPADQDVVGLLFDLVADRLAAARPEGRVDLDLPALEAEAACWIQGVDDCNTGEALVALRILSGLGYGVARPVFGDSTATGSLMRRKLAPVLGRLLDRVRELQNA